MQFTYDTENVCSMQIKFRLDSNRVHDIEFLGGCNGNLKAIARLLEGSTVEEIEQKLLGNTCGRRPTSCTDQLAKAVRKAYDSTK